MLQVVSGLKQLFVSFFHTPTFYVINNQSAVPQVLVGPGRDNYYYDYSQSTYHYLLLLAPWSMI